MSQESNLIQLEFTFTKLRVESMLMQSLQYCRQVSLVILPHPRVYKDVVNKHNHELVQVSCKNVMHQVHEHHRRICHSEWHHSELK